MLLRQREGPNKRGPSVGQYQAVSVWKMDAPGHEDRSKDEGLKRMGAAARVVGGYDVSSAQRRLLSLEWVQRPKGLEQRGERARLSETRHGWHEPITCYQVREVPVASFRVHALTLA